MKLRSHLIALVAVAGLPVLILAVTTFVIYGNDERKDIEVNLVHTSRALSLAVDRELAGSIRALEGLATSDRLDRDDLRGFYDQAARVLKGQGSWQTVVLLTPSSGQLLNLRRPFGSPLPRSAVPDLVKQVAETGRPGVSDLFFGPVAQAHVVVVHVPVARDGKVRYVLGAVINPETLTNLLRQQQVPPEWRATIIDRRRIIIARSTGDMVGQSAPSRARNAESSEGTFRGVTVEGTPVYIGFSRSTLSGWAVAIGVPVAEVEAPLRRTLWTIGGGGLLLLLGGTAVAILLGRRIAGPVRSLSAAAAALASADPPAPRVVSSVKEVSEAARAIEDASALLQRETERRNYVQAQLQESNEELDALVNAAPAAIIALDGNGRSRPCAMGIGRR